MAGVKGKSGGARKGSGRKKVPPADAAGIGDAKEFLERVVRGDLVPSKAQVDAAKALLPFQHRKLGETGKKEQRQEEAGKAGGRFNPAAPPRLVAADGKRV